MSTNLKVLVVALAAILLLGSARPTHAEMDEHVLDYLTQFLLDRFNLGNVCEPVNLFVTGIDKETTARGLTQDTILTTVRSRLRAARLYQQHEITTSYLSVAVRTLPESTAFSVAVQFYKTLSDPTMPAPIREMYDGMLAQGHAVTWEKVVVGQTQNASFILSRVSRLTDEFIDEYLRVNAGDCPRGPLDP